MDCLSLACMFERLNIPFAEKTDIRTVVLDLSDLDSLPRFRSGAANDPSLSAPICYMCTTLQFDFI
jgi:hypothetical protein